MVLTVKGRMMQVLSVAEDPKKGQRIFKQAFFYVPDQSYPELKKLKIGDDSNGLFEAAKKMEFQPCTIEVDQRTFNGDKGGYTSMTLLKVLGPA